MPPIKPAFLTNPEPPVKCEVNQDESSSPKPSDSCFRHLIKLQERQTELSAMITNQQRTSLLLVKEPPMFSGDYFNYSFFIHIFKPLIESKVDSNRDRLYKAGKANDIIKGFVTVNSEDGYKEACKLLAKCFGRSFPSAQD